MALKPLRFKMALCLCEALKILGYNPLHSWKLRGPSFHMMCSQRSKCVLLARCFRKHTLQRSIPAWTSGAYINGSRDATCRYLFGNGSRQDALTLGCTDYETRVRAKERLAGL